MKDILPYKHFCRLNENEDTKVEWDIIVDVTKSWSDMESGRITPAEFMEQYINSLSLKQKEIIQKKGTEVWNKLADKMNKLNENLKQGKLENKDIHPIYDSIYDWADENDVWIKAI